MAKTTGRNATLFKNAVAIAGVRVSTIKVDSSPIDVTDKDSAGIIELLADAATRQISLSVEGVYTDPVLRDIGFSPTASQLMTDITFKFADGLAAADTITGDFFMTVYTEENPYENFSDFKAEFVSSGAWTLG